MHDWRPVVVLRTVDFHSVTYAASSAIMRLPGVSALQEQDVVCVLTDKMEGLQQCRTKEKCLC